jgi:hypothetical protein
MIYVLSEFDFRQSHELVKVATNLNVTFDKGVLGFGYILTDDALGFKDSIRESFNLIEELDMSKFTC